MTVFRKYALEWVGSFIYAAHHGAWVTVALQGWCWVWVTLRTCPASSPLAAASPQHQGISASRSSSPRPSGGDSRSQCT